MNKRLVIDADSHVEEVNETWDYLDEAYRHRRPLAVTTENVPILANRNALWYIDGSVHPKFSGRGATIFATPLSMTYAAAKPFTLGSQGMTEPEARLRDLDRGRLDIQVIFPTIFLSPLTDDPGFEAALMRSYNTWIAKACAHNPKRLKWAAAMPLQDIPAAVEEVARARDLGAVALAIFGTVGDRMLHDRRFDPFFAEAERSRMPVCVHTGWSHPGLRQSIDSIYGAHVLSFTLPVMMAFFSFLGLILDRHPGLRVAFLEAGSDWVPYMLQRMDHYYQAEKKSGWPVPSRKASDYLQDSQIYFTCEAEERLLPEVLKWVGEDRIMISADMPHGEGRESSAEEIHERPDLSDSVKAKILGLNAKVFYNL